MKSGRTPLHNVRLPIYIVAFALTVIPTLGAYHAMRGVLDPAVSVGLDPRIDEELSRAEIRLKDLARQDPEGEPQYRADFERLAEVRRNYGILLEMRPLLNRSLLEVFLIAFGISLALAGAIAVYLNRRILRSYDLAIRNMKVAEQHAAYLETRESWRVVAQKMVHEVKNPLTPIQVMVERLRAKHADSSPDTELSRAIRETEAMVKEEVTKVNVWVESFADYARLPDPRLEDVDLVQVVQGFIEHYGGYWEGAQLRWKEKPATRLPARADSRMLKQVLFNLAKNSVESAAEGKAIIELEFSLSSLPARAILRFADQGPGIAPSLRARLFQPYQTTKSHGTGLGLAICKRILIEHGGDIRYMDAGSGATFELELPIGSGGV